MSEEELEDAFEDEITLLLYTSRIGRVVQGRLCALHWPVAPDAFLVEATGYRAGASGLDGFYWFQRSDPSLIIKPA